MTHQRVLLIAPPFSQLNTPYPATGYLTAFLGGRGLPCAQADLSIETTCALFSRPGLKRLFDAIAASPGPLPDAAASLLHHRAAYEGTIGPVMAFLQGKDATLAHRIARGALLPEGPRFAQLGDLDLAFGDMGVRDRARHLATLYLDDLADLVRATVAPHFGLTRYGERLATSVGRFDPLAEELARPPTLVDELYLERLAEHVQAFGPSLVGFSVPFPGNVLAALRGAQWLKHHHPDVVVVLGGGWVNTELRSLGEPRLFDLVDYVTLDDGERPLLCLLEHLDGARPRARLRRTFVREGGRVVWLDGAEEQDLPQRETGAPTWRGLPQDRYLSVLEVLNPMHRLWSDGRWNKLTLAHGCYWKKCAFCDVSLDYIGRYDPAPARLVVDRMERLVAESGESGFHFVDEAAPPNLLKEVALEILRRGLVVSWWGNVRFERRFDADLCRLLAASGAIAVSGGLEVASDRLLALMAKGVTVEQVARVCAAFTGAGVLVHAYLMYGFPTQTVVETVDSLERVRQLFAAGVLHSGFWHRLAVTAHSPMGLDPERYGATVADATPLPFSHNDLAFEDKTGADHDRLGPALDRAISNYMNGQGLDTPVHRWFEGKTPKTSVAPDLIEVALATHDPPDLHTLQRRAVWLGSPPRLTPRGRRVEVELSGPDDGDVLALTPAVAGWLVDALRAATPTAWTAGSPPTLEHLQASFPGGPEAATAWLESEAWSRIRAIGWVLV